MPTNTVNHNKVVVSEPVPQQSQNTYHPPQLILLHNVDIALKGDQVPETFSGLLS